ncbi:MAG: hypothetical protein GC154_06075 [bacterium]|nr:hypothetical protein [bacterium]
MNLPYDGDLVNPDSLIEWIEESGVGVEFHQNEQFPRSPVLLSEYRVEPPTIHIYRYPLIEDRMNLICQQQAGYFGPWYCLHLAFRFYFHLELSGEYEIERSWRDRLFGGLASLDERAYAFTQNLLSTRYNPARFDVYLERSLTPGATSFR